MSGAFIRTLPRRAALLTAMLLLGMCPAGAEEIFCRFCGRQILPGERYCRHDGKNYCSRECAERAFEKTLPVCAVCGKRCRGRYTVSNGKNYCSNECFENSLPICSVCGRRTSSWSSPDDGSFLACPECAQKPRCFVCETPTDGAPLDDGRAICPRCRAAAITDPDEAERIFRTVRSAMKSGLGLATNHRIAFSLVDRPTLHREAQGISDSPNELGLFVHNIKYRTVERRNSRGRVLSRKTETTSEKFDIYALDFLPREVLEYVCAHELGHDWQAAHYPKIGDPAVKEGFAEYVGWRYNRMRGRHRLNRRIETNPDPVYGEGFRRIRRIADREGFEGVCRYLESQNR